MLPVDFHSHSHFSNCGIHSVIELLTRAKELGMAALAITDHGPELGGRINHTFYNRLVDPVPGIRLLKGMECNLKGTDGSIDMPRDLLPFCDIVLLGAHPNTKNAGKSANTALVLAALHANPCVDIFTHPNSIEYPIDFTALASECARIGVAIEANNSKVGLKRSPDSMTEELIAACRDNHCTMAVCSDAHVLAEIGQDSAIAPLMARVGFPRELVVNRDAQSAFAWLESRRAHKTSSDAR